MAGNVNETSSRQLRFSNGSRDLVICASAVEVLRAHIQDGNKPEAGGILLGKAYTDRDEVLNITVPGPEDWRQRFGFIRRKRPAQRAIDTAWETSKGTLIYLGEWHTHPVPRPVPSGTDLRMIKRMLRTTVMEIDYLYLLIVGLGLDCWLGRQIGENTSELKQIDN